MSQAKPPGPQLWHIDAMGAGGCALVSLVAFLVVVHPFLRARSERASMQSQLVENQQRLADLQQSQGELKGRLADTMQALAAGRLQLQPKEFLNSRMAEIVELASAGGIDIHEMRPGVPVGGERYEMVPIQLSGKGSYPDCAAFLHRLHELLPDTGVVAFELSGNPGNPDAPAAFYFDLSWYAAQARAGVSP